MPDHPSVRATPFVGDDWFETGGPGSFRFVRKDDGTFTDGRDGAMVSGIRFKCPCGCGAIYGGQFDGNGWKWDGNLEAPTVTPSWGCFPTGRKACSVKADGFHWHGFLTAGEFRGC